MAKSSKKSRNNPDQDLEEFADAFNKADKQAKVGGPAVNIFPGLTIQKVNLEDLLKKEK